MTYSPRIIGNKPVPSPSRAEIWKQQLGFDGKFLISILTQVLKGTQEL
jgi:hypothetical protein